MLRRSLLGAPTLAWTLPRVSRAGTPDSLVFSWPSNAGPLDPHGYGPNQMYAQAMLYEPLVRYGAGGAIEPCLATRWAPDEDGRAWTFTLRSGVRFSDGTGFDAAAAKANIDALLRHRERHGWLELMSRIEAAEAPDPATLRLRLDQPYDPTLFDLSLVRPLRFASPAVLRPEGGVSAPVGTGPWRLAESRRGERDVFLRREDYWGEKPPLRQVVVKVVSDANTRALALEAGEIDLTYGADQLDADTFRRFAGDARFTTAISPPMATRMLAINSGRAPTDDPAVRRAIQQGIDRDALVRHVLQGTEPVATSLFAPSTPQVAHGLTALPFDRAAAATALEQAGWRLPPGGKVRQKQGVALALDLCFAGGDALQKALAEAILSDLGRIGIAARLLGTDAATLQASQRSGEFGLAFTETWGPPYDPHAFLGAMRAPSHADWQAQRGLPMKAEIDRRITALLAATDAAAREADQQWVLATLHEQAVYFPISFLTNKLVHRKGLGEVPFGGTFDEIPFHRIRRG
ncbi:nickel ABC transporter substrate-binding protein [Pseudoroseomonas ludipueritiae]|uniref:Nickel ABC transporter, nickel/metallophore periplasmic binding protein n=1 Tax=Pseudoroseomonas ludipueritiae TaxID=198093 RepID=A0ABR7RAD2_9PROT|nr:nickel ABC transporter substrate-binding protein [Pseudoroseomonas ludipueritiae]MBC9178726.1 nickel ABC transporter, nickel/metallophore periplasmic binding protein [Pseudoroseomonas ludipueritiae]